MEQLLVYADFDWLKTPTLIGTLGHESIRGTDCYSFTFDTDWLRLYGTIPLSEDLRNYTGAQYTEQGKELFGCFSDALPDRWGRTLLLRREQLQAQEEHRPVRRLSSFDQLKGIDDFSRMGGFRFKLTPDSEFINSDSSHSIPPLTDLRALERASHEIECSEARDKLPEERWIAQLIHPGSSLGGARPKASVIDEQQALYIAKFPSLKDDYDVGLWEHLAHLLARKAGIQVAETHVRRLGGKHHTLLSRRFDRTTNGRRIHFASAMTLLGRQDGDNASNGYGYLDLIDFMLQHGRSGDCEELYRRVAFNICMGNSDDHFRNHGFELSPKGWILSPAFDLNPTLSTHQTLLISETSSEADLHLLYEAAEDYMLTTQEAKSIITEVSQAFSNWESIARSIGITPREISYFKDRLNSQILMWLAGL